MLVDIRHLSKLKRPDLVNNAVVHSFLNQFTNSTPRSVDLYPGKELKILFQKFQDSYQKSFGLTVWLHQWPPPWEWSWSSLQHPLYPVHVPIVSFLHVHSHLFCHHASMPSGPCPKRLSTPCRLLVTCCDWRPDNRRVRFWSKCSDVTAGCRRVVRLISFENIISRARGGTK